jgi:hypothetical protein
MKTDILVVGGGTAGAVIVGPLQKRATVIASKPPNGSGRPRLDCSTLPTACRVAQFEKELVFGRNGEVLFS